jgi:hypothetical protein
LDADDASGFILIGINPPPLNWTDWKYRLQLFGDMGNTSMRCMEIYKKEARHAVGHAPVLVLVNLLVPHRTPKPLSPPAPGLRASPIRSL